MKKTVLREYLKNREEIKELKEKAIEYMEKSELLPKKPIEFTAIDVEAKPERKKKSDK